MLTHGRLGSKGSFTSLPVCDLLGTYSIGFPTCCMPAMILASVDLSTFTLCSLSYHHAIHLHRFSHIYTFMFWA